MISRTKHRCRLRYLYGPIKTRTVVILSCLAVCAVALLGHWSVRKQIYFHIENPDYAGAGKSAANGGVSGEYPDQPGPEVCGDSGLGLWTARPSCIKTWRCWILHQGRSHDLPIHDSDQRPTRASFWGWLDQDGKHIYAPVGSISDPIGQQGKGSEESDDVYEHVGNGVIVYAFEAGKIAGSG